MNVKRIDEKLRKAIMMAYQYQINCELTPSQCKELIDYIDNPLELEEVCEWVLYYHYDSAMWDIAPSCCVGEFSMNKPNYEICPSCGKRIVYKESE